MPRPAQRVAAVLKDDDVDEHPGRLALWVGLCLAGAAALWLAGFLLLRAAGVGTKGWNSVWGASGASFLSAFLPIPGLTASVVAATRSDLTVGLLAVLGAALGGTGAAALLLALGHTGRAFLRRKATHSQRAKRFLAWSRKAAKKWTYAGVVVLLVPQVIPRAVVLYAAVLAHLRAVPFLAAVFVGTLLRNLLMLIAFRAGWELFA